MRGVAVAEKERKRTPHKKKKGQGEKEEPTDVSRHTCVLMGGLETLGILLGEHPRWISNTCHVAMVMMMIIIIIIIADHDGCCAIHTHPRMHACIPQSDYAKLGFLVPSVLSIFWGVVFLSQLCFSVGGRWTQVKQQQKQKPTHKTDSLTPFPKGDYHERLGPERGIESKERERESVG